MKTRILEISHKEDKKLEEAAQILRNGGTVAFPTETVFGLGANALDENAIKKIYEAKGRPSDNPLIAHIASQEQLLELVEDISNKAKKLMQNLWPGPLTLIFKSKHKVADNVTAGLKTLAVRMPSHEVARELIRLANIPVAAPSANISGRPSPTLSKHVIEDLEGRVDCIIVAEAPKVGLESTILDMTQEPPMLLRPGGITLEAIEDLIGAILVDPAIEHKVTDDLQPKAPGMKYTHYSPKADVKIISGDIDLVKERIAHLAERFPNQKIGIMCTDETIGYYRLGQVLSVGKRSDLSTVASNLFKTLRKFDELGVDIVLCEGYDTVGMGKAIMNRLNKAAGYEIIKV